MGGVQPKHGFRVSRLGPPIRIWTGEDPGVRPDVVLDGRDPGFLEARPPATQILRADHTLHHLMLGGGGVSRRGPRGDHGTDIAGPAPAHQN